MVLLSHISHIFRNFAAMSRYFITFSYDGTNYHGWQIQPNANTVQQELQRALSILLRKEIEVVGAGRTDTGVHARKWQLILIGNLKIRQNYLLMKIKICLRKRNFFRFPAIRWFIA